MLVLLATSFPAGIGGFLRDGLRDGLNTGELWSNSSIGKEEIGTEEYASAAGLSVKPSVARQQERKPFCWLGRSRLN